MQNLYSIGKIYIAFTVRDSVFAFRVKLSANDLNCVERRETRAGPGGIVTTRRDMDAQVRHEGRMKVSGAVVSGAVFRHFIAGQLNADT